MTSTTLEADTSVAARQRRLQLVGLAMLLLLLGGSAYFTLRGVTRELAVARLQSDFVCGRVTRIPDAAGLGPPPERHAVEGPRRPTHAQRQHCYDFLSRESERLEKLVEELLDFGRVEGGAYRYRFERVDAADARA